jgi:prepilin-type N-terminal cleavage/methylation domain-containing protein
MVKPGWQRNRRAFTLLELIVVISVMAVLAAMGFPAYKFIKRQVDIGATQTLVQAVAAAITTYGQKTWSWCDMTAPSTPGGTPTLVLTNGQPTTHTMYLWDLNGANPNDPSNTNQPDCLINAHNPSLGKKYDSIDGTPPNPTLTNDTSKSLGGSGLTTLDGEPKVDNRDGMLPNASFFANNPAKAYGLWVSGYSGFYDMCQPSIDHRFVNSKHQPIDSWKQPLRIAFAANTYGSAWFGVWSAGPDMTDDTADDLKSWATYGSN